jgi:iron complex transport system substrate-binding protein
VAAREGWEAVNAVRDKQLFEIKSPTSCSPARRLTDGVARMHQIILRWMEADLAGTFKP